LAKHFIRFGIITINSEDIKDKSIFEIFEQYDSIAIACNDAGASQTISHIASKLKSSKAINLQLSGPAEEIFNLKNLYSNSENLEHLVQNSQVVLTGTGWQTSIESDILELSHKFNKPSVVVLDHWNDYRQRFAKKNGIIILPSKLIVTNYLSAYLARTEIPEVEVLKITDFYVNDLISKYNGFEDNLDIGSGDVLYLSDGRVFKEDSLDNQTESLNQLTKSITFLENYIGNKINRVIVRPHPADGDSNIPPEVIGGIVFKTEYLDLVEQLKKSSIVIGTDSMAMYVAMKLGKNVVTILNKQKKPKWLDFCASLEELKPVLNSVSRDYCDYHTDSSEIYLRPFGLLDIDESHLTHLIQEVEKVECEENFTEHFTQWHQILANPTQHYHAIIRNPNVRIGYLEVKINSNKSRIELRANLYENYNQSVFFSEAINLILNKLLSQNSTDDFYLECSPLERKCLEIDYDFKFEDIKPSGDALLNSKEKVMLRIIAPGSKLFSQLVR
jgi:hypothetical protein